MATMTALVALSIDMILPALPLIGADLGVERANDNQLVISLLFLGFAVGQFFYGPLSDNTGRKPAAFIGLALYIGGSLLSLTARTFPMMLVGRFFQGAGVAGPRTMTLALVRDKYSGPAMARVMSFIMTIFILVPIVAPSLGQVIQGAAGWRAIFGVYLAMAVLASTWFALRQEETLDPASKIRFSPRRVAHAVRAVLATRKALGYTLAAGCIFGAFLGWLNSAQQILQEQYGLGTRFPLYFAMLAIAVGGASLLNARLVMQHGMRRLAIIALATIGTASVLCLAGAAVTAGHPPLGAMMAYLLVAFFSIGLLFSNLNALAMEPLGHVAGTGASVVGGLSTTISLPLGTIVGQAYDGTVVPLVSGFFVLSLLSMLAMRWAEGGES